MIHEGLELPASSAGAIELVRKAAALVPAQYRDSLLFLPSLCLRAIFPQDLCHPQHHCVVVLRLVPNTFNNHDSFRADALSIRDPCLWRWLRIPRASISCLRVRYDSTHA